MHRREFVAAIGTAAAVVSAAQAFATTANAATAESMHPAKYKALEESTAHCVSAGEACMRHCLGMLSMKDSSMAGCTNASYQMIAACGALRTLAAVNSPHVPALAKVVGQMCADCQKECEKFPDVAECKACGDSCKACAEECRKVAA
ncbi:MAG TPA: four-helix bundle copper-binding protein [Bradyrhizobium sp.]|nr:four-helix bundle copper-binding protein [Bradyrhizobium sp.]